MAEKPRSDLILEQLQRLKRAPGAAVVEEERSPFVIFTLRGGLYAFAGGDVTEILPPMEIFPVPGAPPTVPGVISNRGDIEAVVDLPEFLGLPAAARTARSRILMTEKEGVRSGMLVDSVLDVVDLPPSAIKPPLATLADAVRELVKGETMYQGASVVLLEVSRILGAMRTHGR